VCSFNLFDVQPLRWFRLLVHEAERKQR
jgi:hypothetical protein